MEIGDRVRIARSSETAELGWAAREGIYYGFTTPSVTGIQLIGLIGDIGVNVGFADGVVEWFDSSLVEYLGYDPSDTMTVGDRVFVRDSDGAWISESA